MDKLSTLIYDCREGGDYNHVFDDIFIQCSIGWIINFISAMISFCNNVCLYKMTDKVTILTQLYLIAYYIFRKRWKAMFVKNDSYWILKWRDSES